MRILTVICDLLPRGMQRVARNFAVSYHQQGLESAVLAFAGGGELEASFPNLGLPLFIGGQDQQARQAALRQALSWRPDVVHIHREGPTDSATGAILRALKDSTHRGNGAPIGIMETNAFARVDYSKEGRCVDVHLQLSKWCLWKWRNWSRALNPRPLGVLLPNLVMHEDFSTVSPTAREEFRRQHGIPWDALVFGRVGSPIESKWSPATFQAFTLFAADRPHAWLLIVGLPPELNASLESMPEALRQRVVNIPFLVGDRALNNAYGAMDVFLHASSIGESFGMVLAESLLSGTPVITLSTPTKDNSQIEIVGHEYGGLVAADVQGMVRAMHLLEDAAVRRRYAIQGAQTIVERFGPETVVPRAIAIARLCALGLTRQELGRRLLAIPGLCPDVSLSEMMRELRRCIGRHQSSALMLMRLVSNPHLYRLYRWARQA
jgi:glycosyltransferase involved in cell wall biosynthesis